MQSVVRCAVRNCSQSRDKLEVTAVRTVSEAYYSMSYTGAAEGSQK